MSLRKVIVCILVMGTSFLCIKATVAGRVGQHVKVSADIHGPSACNIDSTIRVTVTLRSGSWGIDDISGIPIDVTLFEDDILFFDDKVGTKTVFIGQNDSKTVEFSFNPRKFERTKHLEFYARISSTHSLWGEGQMTTRKIKVICR